MATICSRRTAAVSPTAPAVIEPAAAAARAGRRTAVIAVSPWIGGDVGDVHAQRVGGELHDGGLEAVPGRAADIYTLTLPDGSIRIVAPSVA